MKRIASSVLCWSLALLAGAAADYLGVPLAWVLGPLLVAAAASMAGITVVAPQQGRRFGQVVIGAAIGLNMTASAVVNLATWLPVMVAAALVSILIGAVMGTVLARYGRIDDKTAFFAMVPGGLAEMANIGASLGARSEVVALSHALRVALAVCIMPPVVLAIGEDGGIFLSAARHDVDWLWVAILLTAGLGGVQVMRLLRVANPWMLGSLVAVAVLAGSEVVEGRIPAPVLWAGQFFIGMAIGIRFKRDIVRKLARLAAASSALTVLAGCLLLLVAAAIAAATSIDIASAALGVSPGGFAEMAITAEMLRLDVTLVAGFHVVRAFMVNSLIIQCWTALNRLGFFSAAARLLR